jgi:GTP-binding protein HflX
VIEFRKTARERAYLFALHLTGDGRAEVELQLQELAELARTAGAEVVGSEVQRRDAPDPALFLGKGKVDELHETHHRLQFDLVIFLNELSPRQQRNLERALDVKVLDRTELILDIFAGHARTREGRLQVESAQLHHVLPRLAHSRDYSRPGGGIGTRGPGEQKLEVDRRRIRHRIRELDREIKDIRKHRTLHRTGRRRLPHQVVAIVGYTNSGKSTLLNALTTAHVTAEDRLFATLDPTTRQLRLPSHQAVLLTDTVGFIQDLPTDLVAAFRATLEEIHDADALLQVVDATSPAWRDHLVAVGESLDDLEALDKPRLLALNKVDRCEPARVRALQAAVAAEQPLPVIPISALTGGGLPELRTAIGELLAGDMVSVEALIPYADGARQAEFHARGQVEQEEFLPAGVAMRGKLPRQLAARFRPYLVQAAPTQGRASAAPAELQRRRPRAGPAA